MIRRQGRFTINTVGAGKINENIKSNKEHLEVAHVHV